MKASKSGKKNYPHFELTEYLVDIHGANKHEINGYKLFKENCVKDGQVKPSIKGAQVIFIVKCHAVPSTKRIRYTVYLSQSSGGILFGKCNCKTGVGGCCKHKAALL